MGSGHGGETHSNWSGNHKAVIDLLSESSLLCEPHPHMQGLPCPQWWVPRALGPGSGSGGVGSLNQSSWG